MARAVRSDRFPGIKARESRVLQEYVALVSRLPFVEEVRAEPGYEGLEIWTVIDSEPFERGPRDEVYDAELNAVATSPGALVDYRLINRLEYGDQNTAWALPEGAFVAWRRAPRS